MMPSVSCLAYTDLRTVGQASIRCIAVAEDHVISLFFALATHQEALPVSTSIPITNTVISLFKEVLRTFLIKVSEPPTLQASSP